MKISLSNMEDKSLMERVVLLLISGKRKCGKDYIASRIHESFGTDESIILRISAPLKKEYAKIHGLDYTRLLDSTAYKEQHRASMVEWGEEKRRNDPGYFCRQLFLLGSVSRKPVWIIADIRRKTDIEFFEKFKNIKLRVTASDKTRQKRDWTFVCGIDDSETENDLDDYDNWDLIIENDGDKAQLHQDVNRINNAIQILKS